MATLTTGKRQALPTSAFALSRGRFPIPDRTHARLAVQMAPRAQRAGHISAGQVATIRRKVQARFPSIQIGRGR